jgi:hypothetical protein
MTVFWDVTPCSLIETDWHLGGADCLHLQGDRLDYTVQHLRRQSSSDKSNSALIGLKQLDVFLG